MIDLTFEDVCKLVEQDADRQILETTNGILDVILILSGVAIGSQVPLPPDAIGLIASMIEVKNEMTARILPKVLDILNWVTGRKPETPYEKEQRMAAAYVLICYAAFFEALEKVLPELMETVELKPSEKHRLSESASERLKICADHTVQLSDSYTSDLNFILPHPTDTFKTIEQRLLPLYKKLAGGFLSFLECLVIWEETNGKQKFKIGQTLRDIPEQAFEYFKGHYYALGTEYNEFFVWAIFHSFEETQNYMVHLTMEAQVQSDNITDEMQKVLHFVEENSQAIDVGFNNLEQLVRDLSVQATTLEEEEALKILSRRYVREVDEVRIIEDEYDADNGEIHLAYPKRSEIFIPQSYRFLRYSGKGRLESEKTWKGEPRNDFGTFLVNYLQSPYSLYTPLVVLGHPGSGKSMLTRFIAARLKSSSFAPIRIELRKINAELSIRDQIVDQIKVITGNDVQWSGLRRIFKGHPMLVILDGYDELLQASGKTFASYLRDVSAFQQEVYSDHNQPVHAIVTSRITLIDQAMIPAGATIVRLEPFNKEQCNRWVNIWNGKNSSYFETKSIKPFALPIDNDKIMELAEQPLLLLMLALYDSDNNALQEKVDLSRTILYDDLLRRFVKREQEKDSPLDEIASQSIETDMSRLGAVAASMFNRRALDIKSDQLDRDLTYFGLEREIQARPQSGGSELSQGQLLFGSFFFVHKAESTREGAIPNEQKKDEAYEFLHNTFGEFLTADFILRHLIQQVKTVHGYKQSELLRSKLPEWLEKRDSLSKEWFSTLMYTPLSSRPVVLEMMRERLQHHEVIEKISREEFITNLNEIVASQINRLLEKREFPSIMSTREENSFGYLPLLGHAAIYSLNLVLISTILSPDEYIFIEDRELASSDGTRPWDRLTSLWRSWFSLENLNSLTAILMAEREDTKIRLKAKDTFGTSSSSDRLDLVLNVSRALADDITAGLAGLLLHDLYKSNTIELPGIGKRLRAETIDLEVMLRTKQLQEWCLAEHDSGARDYIAKEAVRIAGRSYGGISDALVSLLKTESLRVARDYDDIRMLVDVYEAVMRRRSPQVWSVELVTEIAQLARELDEIELLKSIYTTLKYYDPERMPMGLLVELLRLAREFGDSGILDSVYVNGLLNRAPEMWSVELVTEVVQWVRKFGDSGVLREIYGNLMHSDLKEMPVESLVELLRLAREFGDRGMLDRVYRGSRRRDPAMWSVELVTELAQLAREFGERRVLEDMYENLRRSDPGRLPVGLLVELLRLAREFGDSRMLDETYGELRHRDLARMPVELVAELAQLARKFGDRAILRDMYEQLRHQDPETWTVGFARTMNQLARDVGDHKLEQKLKRILWDD